MLVLALDALKINFGQLSDVLHTSLSALHISV